MRSGIGWGLVLATWACSGKVTSSSSSSSTTLGSSAGSLSTGTSGGSSHPVSTSSSGGTATSTGAGTGSGTGSSSGSTGSCLAAPLAHALGRTHTLVGFSGADATASAAPFDLRYIYLSGGLFDGTSPCASCADSSCTAANHACSNAGGGCAWWGCWQYDQDPPGSTARTLVSGSEALAAPQIPMFTYYEILQASGLPEGATEVAAINDAAFLERYLADFRFLLQQIGTSPAIVHVEPDFWGYAQQLNADPHQVPSTVATSNTTDCASMEASVVGFGQCLIAMARKYAPNAKIGLHASNWASGTDVLDNTDATIDVASKAQSVATFMAPCAAGSDLVVTDISDRDAAYYQSIGRSTWWDTTNATLPNFHQAWAFGKALSEGMQVPVLYWQVPVGNTSLPNNCNEWQDNRVDYLLAHLDEVAAGNAIGVAFGAGASCMTTPETDNGNLIAKLKALAPQPVCGP